MNIYAKAKARRVRLVAACLLFFAVADVVCPPPSCCCGVEGLEGYTAASTDHASRASSQTASVEKRDDAPQEKHDCTTCDDDCFCCGHATAVAGVATTIISVQKLPPAPSTDQPIQTPPLRGTFRPPRLT
jgi:hypothetical protein